LFEEKDGRITKNDLEQRKIPAHVINALEKATQEDPSKRYQSIDDFLRGLCKQAVQRKEPLHHRTLKVRDKQFGLFVAINCAYKVNGSQGASFAAVNYAHKVKEDQFASLAAVNCAGYVNEDQLGGLVGINYAHEVGET
jgi:hypothetical protein